MSYWDDHDLVEDAADHRDESRSPSEQWSRAEDEMAQFHVSQDRDDVIAREQAFLDEVDQD
jgi:hypothetical protein